MNMNSNNDTKNFFETPRKSGKVHNSCAPRRRKGPTKAEARLQRRIDAFMKSETASNPAYTKPGSLNK